MPSSLFHYLCLVLSLLSVGAAAVAADAGSDGLVARQNANAGAAGGNTPTVVSCEEYARIANLTIIGLNSTYRAAFLRSGPFGTDTMSGMVDQAAPKLPALTMDPTLNQQCGNSTAIAIVEAANNLTKGIVADFQIVDAPGITLEGNNTWIICLAILIFMGSIFMTME